MSKTNIRGTQILDTSVDLTVDVTGTLPVANGGTGAATLSGVLVGNGTSAVTAVAAPSSTIVGITDSQTLTSKTLTTPVLNGIPTGTGVATAATASTLALRDTNGNLAAAGMLEGYTTTATAAGTTTLTVSSNYLQFFTGSTTQTVTLPVASTLALGQQWLIVNASTGAVTVQSSGANAILGLAAGTSAMVTCILVTGTTAASWQVTYFGDVITSGKKLSVSNTLTFAGTDATTITFQGTDTYVGRTTTDTLANKRITARIGTVASSATPTPDADAHDQYNVTLLAANAVLGAPTGTPVDGQHLTVRIKPDATPRTLGYNAIYRALGVTLPATTVASKTLYLGMIYNLADTKWDVVAFSMEA